MTAKPLVCKPKLEYAWTSRLDKAQDFLSDAEPSDVLLWLEVSESKVKERSITWKVQVGED